MEDTTTTTPRPRHRLVDARISQHWSQQEVADRIGTTHVNVSRWERGITRPSPYFRRKLSKLFDKSEEDLDLLFQPPVETVEAVNVDSVNVAPALDTMQATPTYDGVNGERAANVVNVVATPAIYDPIIPGHLQPRSLGVRRRLPQLSSASLLVVVLR